MKPTSPVYGEIIRNGAEEPAECQHSILALAGYDPKACIEHYAGSVAALHELPGPSDDDIGWTATFSKFWTRTTHPNCGATSGSDQEGAREMGVDERDSPPIGPRRLRATMSTRVRPAIRPIVSDT